MVKVVLKNSNQYHYKELERLIGKLEQDPWKKLENDPLMFCDQTHREFVQGGVPAW